MTLEELEVYRLAMDIGERVWSEVVRWDHFAKDTIGKQLVRAADSVAANLSEGYGRFHFKENNSTATTAGARCTRRGRGSRKPPSAT
jgi:four helix bundle protein